MGNGSILKFNCLNYDYFDLMKTMMIYKLSHSPSFNQNNHSSRQKKEAGNFICPLLNFIET